MSEEDSGRGKRRSRAGEEGKAVITSVLESLITTSGHIIMIGAANTPAVYKMCAAVDHLLSIGETGIDFYMILYL